MEQDCLLEQVFYCFLFSVLHRVLISTHGLEHVFIFHTLPLNFLIFDRGEAREPTPEVGKAIKFL